jgi:hypothetical protein
LNAYLSTDNIQFLVNRVSGGMASKDTINFPIGSPTMDWRSMPSTMSPTLNTRYYDIRMDSSNNPNEYPDPSDYREPNVITKENIPFAVLTWKTDRLDHILPAYVPSNRTHTSVYSCQFWGENHISRQNLPIRALVLGYVFPGYTLTIPVLDMVLTDKNGDFPAVNQSNHTYTVPTDSSPPTNYFYLPNGAQLTFSFNMTWTSDCVGADGC